MKRLLVAQLLCVSHLIYAQSSTSPDTTRNNLEHTKGYQTCEYGIIPQFIKKGKGRQVMMLIPGLGFDASVFSDFMKANRKKYTMYAITIPGYGMTPAPPMPLEDKSYGKQYWNVGVEQGLIKLIEKEKLTRPVLVGHFVQGAQLALRMAIDYPEQTGGVITLGGPAKFVLVQQGQPVEYPLSGTISYIDKVTAPQWFKMKSKEDFDAGNYSPEVYSLTDSMAKQLWNQSASVHLPVAIRYTCEFFASDVTLELGKVACPVLVLRPTFSESVLANGVNNYLRPQFIDSWDKAKENQKLSFQIKDIAHASTFIWKDNPTQTFAEIDLYMKQLPK